MYFAGSFDSINGGAMGNVVKYQALTPVHAAASYDSIVCAGGSVTFTNLSTGSSPTISWTFPGDSPSTSTANNPTVSFTIAGN
ncbi:PKD domain-containing protein, partial [Acinetobacter baumannii]